jgi:hypothetical protein
VLTPDSRICHSLRHIWRLFQLDGQEIMFLFCSYVNLEHRGLALSAGSRVFACAFPRFTEEQSLSVAVESRPILNQGEYHAVDLSSTSGLRSRIADSDGPKHYP